jgi:hypothetical protein
MTLDYKKILFEFLIGKLQKQYPQVGGGYKKISNIDLSNFNNYIPVSYNALNFEGVLPYKDNVILYGGYDETDGGNGKGIIVVCNSDFIPQKVYYKYESGTDLRYIQQLNVTTDGQFYMIDSVQYTPTTPGSAEKRLVLLNNFVVNNKLNINKSYIFPDLYRNFYAKKIFKDTNTGNYVFLGLKDTEIGWNLKVIHFKTAVGQDDEWKTWEADTNTAWLFGDGYVEFNSDGEPFIELIICPVVKTNKNIILWKKDFTDTYLKASNIVTPSFKTYIDSENYRNQAIFMNKNEVYYVLNNQLRTDETQKEIGLYKCDLSTGTIETLFAEDIGTFDYINQKALYINSNQGELYAQYNDNISTTNNTADYYYMKNTKFGWLSSIVETAQTYYSNRMFYVSNVFNLVNMFMLPTNYEADKWLFYEVTILYNKNDYTDYNYKDINSLVPQFVNLLDNNDDIIFSRNLYNKVLTGGTTQSTIQIPNTYLNDKIIKTENLQGQTNITLVTNEQEIQKNKYEVLNINFINSIKMQDENDPTNVIENSVGATRLNSSTSDKADYDDAKMSKVRIIYEDGTSFVNNLDILYTEVYNQLEPALINAYITVIKQIKELQLISNDEKTIYLSITELPFEIGKTYLLQQWVNII